MQEPNTLGDWFETYTGKCFDILNVNEDMIDIRDIAHALSNTGRFNGHGAKFYSVAEHSYHVSYLCSDPVAGLLHDASEAYLADIVSPIKPYLTGYKPLENAVMRVIAKRYGFEYPLTKDIKLADSAALSTEANVMIRSKGDTWAWNVWSPTGERPNKYAFIVYGWSPELAEKYFLKRFYEVCPNEALRKL